MDFAFGIDSVLLSDFAKKIRPGSTICDLGTGTGIISILLSKKVDSSKIIAFEKQRDVFDMAFRSIKMNGLENDIKIINSDILEIDRDFRADAVVTNSVNVKKQISRFESSANLDDWIRISSRILKDFGEFYMVYRPERLSEVFSIMNKYKIEPKVIRFVHSKVDEHSTMVLIKGVKLAKCFLKIEKPLIIYNNDGSYTSEINEIYNGDVNGKG